MCAFVRALQSLATDTPRIRRPDRGPTGVIACGWRARVSPKPPLHGPTSVACLHSSHVRTTGWHALLRARASRWLFVAQTLPFEDGTSRRLLRRRSLVTAGRSRRRSHLRLHIPGVHCCTPVCQGESIRRPIPALPGSSHSDRDDSTFTSISGSGLSSSGLHNPYIGHTGRSTVIPKNSHYERLYSGMSPCTTQYTGDVFEHSPPRWPASVSRKCMLSSLDNNLSPALSPVQQSVVFNKQHSHLRSIQLIQI